ncbi:MAG: cbb3-type cytochrome oxidase subunit 3 [Granulosicoccaceae bacterium]
MSPALVQSIATPLALLAFAAVVWWAYGSKKRGRDFDKAANSLFDEKEEEMHQRTLDQQEKHS